MHPSLQPHTPEPAAACITAAGDTNPTIALVFPPDLTSPSYSVGLSGADEETCQFAAALLQSLVRASRPMASTLYDLGVVPPLVAQLQQCARGQSKGSPLAAAAALGHICDAQPDAAKMALEHGVIAAIASLLGTGGQPHGRWFQQCAVPVTAA